MSDTTLTREADADPGEVTRLLDGMREGDESAVARLMPIVYEELHALAQRYFRGERTGHTLQPTALVHEAFLRLVGARPIHWTSRAHFVGIAARVMRQILVNHAEGKNARKRGRGRATVALDDAVLLFEERSADLVDLDEALEALAKLDPAQCRLVELRFFGGLSVEECARVLGMSPRTVEREWAMARSWLRRRIGAS